MGGVEEETPTITDALVVALLPKQLKVYVVVAVGETTSLPESGLVPLQPSEARQLEVCIDDHVSVEVAPERMCVGFALKSSVGGGRIAPTVTDCVLVAMPFPQESEYVVVAFTVTISLPERPLLPLHPSEA
jgi:hypothetical protein